MRLYNKDDLKSSRIFFDKEPPNYMTIFIFSITLITLMIIILSNFIHKSYIVNAPGIISTIDACYISSSNSGTIVNILKKEGDTVKSGDVLFKISNGIENSKISSINNQLNNLEKKEEVLNLYNESLNDKTNYMNNSGVQQAYYGRVEYYLDVLANDNYTVNDLKTKLVESQIKQKDYEKELEELQVQLNEIVEKKGELTDIKQKIEEKKSEIEEQINNINQINKQLENPSLLQKDSIYQQLITELGSERDTLLNEKNNLKNELSYALDELETMNILATQSGSIHYITPLKEGMSIQQAQVVAEINEIKNEKYIVEASIAASEISKVTVGDNTRIEIEGVNSQKYGYLTGHITEISNGTFYNDNEQGGEIYYMCTISIEKNILESSSGDKIHISNSMPVNAKIVYNKETYFEWFLDLFGF